jgi:hypothetical protein
MFDILYLAEPWLFLYLKKLSVKIAEFIYKAKSLNKFSLEEHKI